MCGGIGAGASSGVLDLRTLATAIKSSSLLRFWITERSWRMVWNSSYRL